MPFQPVPNTLQIAVHTKIQGDDDATNVLHVTYSGGYTHTQVVADLIAAEIHNFFSDIANMLNTEFLYVGCDVTDIRTQGAPSFFSNSGGVVVGLDTSGPLPNQNAAQMNLRTSLRGAAFRGRFYVSGFAFDTNDHSGLTLASQASLEIALQDLMDDLAAAGVPLVVVSRFLNGSPRVTGLTTPVTRTSVRRIWASLARRRPGR